MAAVSRIKTDFCNPVFNFSTFCKRAPLSRRSLLVFAFFATLSLCFAFFAKDCCAGLQFLLIIVGAPVIGYLTTEIFFIVLPSSARILR